jgi:hypothetical protein
LCNMHFDTQVMLATVFPCAAGCCLPYCSSHGLVFPSFFPDIVLKQDEVGKWPPRPPAGASSLPDSDYVPGPLQPTEPRPSSTAGRPVTRGWAAQQGSSSAGIVPSSGVQHRSHPEEALECTRAFLGAGQCGYVVEGR